MHSFVYCALKLQQSRASTTAGRVPVLVLSRRLSRSAAAAGSRKSTLRLSSTGNTTASASSRNNLKQPLHSSAKTQQSTPTLSMEQQGIANNAAEIAKQQSLEIPRPTMEQLKVLFTASAVPMIGFGFMDNIVMIQAGSLIDNTIGVSMGLATLTAAAAGQVVSDVSGVLFGGSLERFLHRYRLIQSSTLTSAQRALPLCRNVALFGAVCGVALGCGLGASCLLFMDLEARERAERAIQLQAVLNDMMMEAADEDAAAGSSLHCESCTIHLAHLPATEQFSTHHKALQKGKTKIDFLPPSVEQQEIANNKNHNNKNAEQYLAVRAAQTGQSVLNENGTILCTPILSKEKDGEALAVLEFHIKEDSGRGFSSQDVAAAKVMARHISIFMHRLSD